MRPNAGRIARRRPRTKHGRRALSSARPWTRTRGCTWRERAGFGDDVHAPAGGRVAGFRVVVAAHQDQRQRGMPLTPLDEGRVQRRDHAGLGVQEVAQDDQPRGAGRGHQRGQAGEVGGGGSAWNGHSAGPESRRLAEVNVGDEQGPGAGPEQGAVGAELDRLVAQDDREALGVAAGRGQRFGKHAEFARCSRCALVHTRQLSAGF